MIEYIKLIKNVGQFELANPGDTLPLKRLSLIYAENGRGKSTLTAILRSLTLNDPVIVQERQRLGTRNPPLIVLAHDSNSVSFFRGNWSRPIPNLVVFDDEFVNRNVYSGLAVEPVHRQNLHDLVIGSQAVALNLQLKRFIAAIEQHNSSLRQKRAEIPVAVRGNLSVEDFCALPVLNNADQEISSLEQALIATQQKEQLIKTEEFSTVPIFTFDIDALRSILAENISTLDGKAITAVTEHFEHLGEGSEVWVSQGLSFVTNTLTDCPFCGQTLNGSPLIDHYRSYFSAAYNDLKNRIADYISQINDSQEESKIADFERSIRTQSERATYWSKFLDVPSIIIDTEAVTRNWIATRSMVLNLLAQKQMAPLETISLPVTLVEGLETHQNHSRSISDLNQSLREANEQVGAIKRQVTSANLDQLQAQLERARLQQKRYEPSVAPVCDSFMTELAQKRGAEQRRDATRTQLDQQRFMFFQQYEETVNQLLQQLGASFKLQSMNPRQVSNGSTCTYQIFINNSSVPVTAPAGSASFRTVLSAGDRNTLALAFFFASLRQSSDLADKIVVIDDPVSSLDDSRLVATCQQIGFLLSEVHQMILLSHNRRFLAYMWQQCKKENCSTLAITRDTEFSSVLGSWDVKQDMLTEHDVNFQRLKTFLEGPNASGRDVATAIRPFLEGFLRVAYPDYCPPGTLLGEFIDRCYHGGAQGPPMSLSDLQELQNIKDYANRFHHDTNSVSETTQVNDGELASFVRRALAFARRP